MAVRGGTHPGFWIMAAGSLNGRASSLRCDERGFDYGMRFGNVELHNVCDLIEGDGKPGFGVSRLPKGIRGQINKGASNRSMLGAGCEIRGVLPEGGQARIVLQEIDSNTTPPVVTVCHGCFCGQSVFVAKKPTGLRTDLVHPSDEGMQEMGEKLAMFISRHISTESGKGAI
jgi:hypothetical protein